MAQGKVKKIMTEKGFGFIEGPHGKDIFFHSSSVADAGFDGLQQGQTVDFEMEQESRQGKGPRAKTVRPLSRVASAIEKVFEGDA